MTRTLHTTACSDHDAAQRALTTKQFDTLDLLHTLDAHVHAIGRDRLALELGGISTEAAHVRMTRLERAGLVDIEQASGNEPSTYTLSELGRRLYKAELLRMVGVTAPPSTSQLIDLPSLIAARIVTLTEPRMTA